MGLVLLGAGSPKGRALTGLARHSLGRVLDTALMCCSSLWASFSSFASMALLLSMLGGRAGQAAGWPRSLPPSGHQGNGPFPLIGNKATPSHGRCPAPTAIAAGLGTGTSQSQSLLGRLELARGGSLLSDCCGSIWCAPCWREVCNECGTAFKGTFFTRVGRGFA